MQSLNRALAILDALADSERGLTLTVLARRVALPPSSAHRLLTTLQRQRFVRFEPASMCWQIGVHAFVVGNAFVRSRDVVTLAKPFMRRPMERTGETINLYVLNAGEAVCLAQVPGPQMMPAISRPGGGVRVHRSAAGKAMLAHRPPGEVAEMVAMHGMPRATGNTIVSLPKLEAELARARLRGYAVDDEEFMPGLRCVAAAVLDESGMAQAAISVAGPAARMTDERLAALGNVVAAAARSVTIELGGTVQSAGERG